MHSFEYYYIICKLLDIFLNYKNNFKVYFKLLNLIVGRVAHIFHENVHQGIQTAIFMYDILCRSVL